MNLSKEIAIVIGILVLVTSVLLGIAVIQFSSDINTLNIILVISVLIIASDIGAAVFLEKVIRKQIKDLRLIADKLALGVADVTVSASSDDEIGALMQSFGKISDNIKSQAAAAEKIASGDLSIEIIPRSDRDILADSMKSMINNLKSLADETYMLTESAIEGDLSVRGNADSFKGRFKEMIEGINKTFDGSVEPYNAVLNFLQKTADGEETEEIENIYKGQYGVLIEKLLMANKSLKTYFFGLNYLLTCEDFYYVPDFESHNGIYRRSIKSVDDVLGALIQPLLLSSEYMLKIANGEIPEKIKIETEHDVLSDILRNINACIDGLHGLAEGRDVLERMSVKDYSTKVNGSYKGIFAEIGESVNEVNQVMNDIVGIMNDMANGDLTLLDEIMALQQASEQDTLTPAGQRMVQNIYNSVEAVTMLTDSVVNGILDTRADEDKFEGSWKKLVAGMNMILGEVSKPVKDITNAMQEISNGNLHIAVKGSYKGNFATLSEAVNETSMTLSSIMEKITGVIELIADGNLDLMHMDQFRGDFVSISNSINAIIDSLNSVLGEINTAAEQVASGSIQVSEGSQTLSRGSTEQASAVEQLTASLSEVSTQTKQNAVSAEEANELSIKVKEYAEKGNSHMFEMLESMRDISESSSNISKIIKVIDDIAFQTNILALNAAVEAARAGHYGKGFAVVAEEVRNLASRSADAAKDTTNLIEDSINKVQTGTKIANDTALALNEIVTAIEKAADLVVSISDASNEQASAIIQINKGIKQVSEVVRNNSATAEESAAASEELSGQAEVLKEMVGKFRLRQRAKGLSAGGTMLLMEGHSY